MALSKETCYEFWIKFNEQVKSNGAIFPLGKALPCFWYDVELGSPLYCLRLSLNSVKNLVVCTIWISDSEKTYNKFFSNKVDLQRNFREPLQWKRSDSKKSCSIEISKEADITNQEQWDDLIDWMIEKAEKFYKCFC